MADMMAYMERRTQMSEHTADYDAGYRDALDEVERRIRHQASVATVGSMEWRAHFADLAHVEAIRSTSVTPPAKPCDCGADGDGIGGCPRCLGAGEVYVFPPAE